MPNAVRYLPTNLVPGAIKKGAVALGLTGNLGPTSTTTWFNGITPQSGKYVIYDVGSVAGIPLIYAPQNSDELKRLALYFGASSGDVVSETTILQFFATKSTLMVANFDYENIVTDGLVVNLDAGFAGSYPNGGNTWYDLSGNNNTLGPAQYLPTFSTVGGAQCFRMDGQLGQGFVGSIAGTMPTANATLESWVYASANNLGSDDRGCIILITGGSGIYQSWNLSNNNLSNYWYAHNPEGYWENGIALTRQTWLNLISVWDYNSSTLKQYVNGSLVGTFTTQGNATTGTTLYVGLESTYRPFPGYISIVRVYNTPLSSTQVLQNFNAQKARFGL